MGNKIGRRRPVIDEKYTRPQGLYQLRDIDHKKLRKLILDSKLAPCYPGDDDGYTLDLEECPICFLFFPSLNRSKCCSKGICTECFLQMKPSHPARSSQCPFCKTSNYAVEYRGAKTKEEKGVERIEEQRVLEAKIKMRQQELQDEKRKLRKKEEQSSSSRSLPLAEVEYQDVFSGSYSARCFRYSVLDDEVASSQGSCSAAVSGRPSHSRQNREDNFDLDLENRMIMQAIWQSIQEQGIQRSPSPCNISSNLPLQNPLFSENCFTPQSEPHQMCVGSMTSMPSNGTSASGVTQCSPATFAPATWNVGMEQSSRLPHNAPNSWMLIDHHGSNIMEVGMNYSGMSTMDSGHVVAVENFEETGARMSSEEQMWL